VFSADTDPQTRIRRLISPHKSDNLRKTPAGTGKSALRHNALGLKPASARISDPRTPLSLLMRKPILDPPGPLPSLCWPWLEEKQPAVCCAQSR